MKKKLSLILLPLIASPSLLSMESKANIEKHPLEESALVPPMPTERGFGILRSVKDMVWDYPEENLFKDLENKAFNPNNSSYPRKLDTAIEIFVEKKNNNRITETFELCREHYPKQIKIGDSQARMAHDFLVKENKDKQMALKEAIEAKDKKFIAQYNALLNTLQESLSQQVKTINELLTTHIKERNVFIEKEGNEIRRLKKGLVNLHHLNKPLTLPQGGYCSDDEKNADNVKNSYNDEYLLKKINIAYSMQQTKIKTENTLKGIYKLNDEIQAIEPVRY